MRGKFIIRDFLCRIGVDGMKMQIMIHTHTHTNTYTLRPLSFHSPIYSTLLIRALTAHSCGTLHLLHKLSWRYMYVLNKGVWLRCMTRGGGAICRAVIFGVLTLTKAGVYNDRRFSDCTRMKALHWFFSCVCGLYVHVY